MWATLVQLIPALFVHGSLTDSLIQQTFGRAVSSLRECVSCAPLADWSAAFRRDADWKTDCARHLEGRGAVMEVRFISLKRVFQTI